MKKSLLGLLLIFSIFSCKDDGKSLSNSEQSIQKNNAKTEDSNMTSVPISEDKNNPSKLQNSDKITLKFSPEINHSSIFQLQMKILGEGTQKIDVETHNLLQLKVIETNKNNSTMQMLYKAMQVKMRMGAMEVNYNSNDKEHKDFASILDKQLQPLFKNPCELKVDSNGKVTEFELPIEAHNSQNTFGTTGIILPLPAKPVGIGDSWNAVQNMNGFGEMDLQCTVKNIKDNLVTIATKGKIKTNEKKNSGQINGQYQINQKTGMVVNGNLKMSAQEVGQNINMEMNFQEKK